MSDERKAKVNKSVKEELNKMRPIPPGEILLLDFILPSFAVEVNMNVDHLQAIISGEKKITKIVAKKLSKKYRTTEEFWLNLQKNYDDKKE